MPIKAKYLFVASMDVDADKEALFNEVYDTEHIPLLSKVPGVHAVSRMVGEPFAFSIGGEEKKMPQSSRRVRASVATIAASFLPWIMGKPATARVAIRAG